jgi:hypothetical protein
MTAGFQLGVIESLALSVASSVAIVICNKALISTLGFPFGKDPSPAVHKHGWYLMNIRAQIMGFQAAFSLFLNYYAH